MSFVAAALLSGALFGAASPEPAASPGGATTWCPVAVAVTPLDPSRIALSFWTPLPTGRGSGTVRLIANGSRYDVRFDDAVILHRARAGADVPAPVPLVIRFPGPVRVESAVVTSLDAPAPGPCSPPYAPWTPYLTALPWGEPDTTYVSESYRARAARAPVRDAPAPAAYVAPVCANRFVPAKTVRAFEPQWIRYEGRVNVLVTVGVDGKAIAVEVPNSSGNAVADAVAKDAAVRSQYSPQIFDCEKIIGTYVFSVEFSINSR